MQVFARFAKSSFHIDDMDCPKELGIIEKKLDRLPGIIELRPNYVARTLQVAYDPGSVQEASIFACIRETGFAVRRQGQAAAPAAAGAHFAKLITTAGGGILFVVALLAYRAGTGTLVLNLLLVASTLLSGLFVLRSALRAARNGALEMNSLMVIAAVGALCIGEGFEAATAMFLFSFALDLENLSLGRARHAIRALMELVPAQATRIKDGKTEGIPAAEVAVGDRLLVRPGEKIPVDGVVLSGRSTVNQAHITGESRPIDKAVGDELYSGTLNGEGSLEMETRKPAAESTVARIAQLVEEAQNARAPSQRLVETFARYYTPIVIALAIAISVIPPLANQFGFTFAAGADWHAWIYRGLVLLVVSCPCALVISTPVTVVCGLFQAARRGILIKGGMHLENAGRLRAFVFDKTGTLTYGRLAVAEVVALDAQPADTILALAAAVESHSEHPIAKAIVRAAHTRRLELPPMQEFASHRGAGAEGQIHGQLVQVGSPRLIRAEQGADPALAAALRKLEEWPQSGVLVARAGVPLGLILLHDDPRPEAAAAIASLRALGTTRIAILSGDNLRATRRVGDQVGVDEVYADLTPLEKVEKVREFVARNRWVGMIGDGVNDAPALAAATVGMAMGTAGSDTALETADVALMSDNLSRLPELVELGRRTRSIVWQNVAFSLITKLIFVALTIANRCDMWMAVAADAGASLLVIFNGMRLWKSTAPSRPSAAPVDAVETSDSARKGAVELAAARSSQAGP